MLEVRTPIAPSSNNDQPNWRLRWRLWQHRISLAANLWSPKAVTRSISAIHNSSCLKYLPLASVNAMPNQLKMVSTWIWTHADLLSGQPWPFGPGKGCNHTILALSTGREIPNAPRDQHKLPEGIMGLFRNGCTPKMSACWHKEWMVYLLEVIIDIVTACVCPFVCLHMHVYVHLPA